MRGEIVGCAACLAEKGTKPPELVVLPTDVVNAADGWPVSDCAVWSCPVVVVEPVWQRFVAVSM